MNSSLFSSGPTAATLAWVRRVVEDPLDDAEDLELALQAEVCAALCADAAPRLVPSALELVARTRVRAARAFERLGARAFELPDLLPLLAAVAEDAAVGEPARPLAEHARAAAATLRAPRARAELKGCLAPHLLLARLGLNAGPDEPAIPLPSRLGRNLLRHPAALADGLDQIETACQFGLHSISAPRTLSPHLGAVLFCRLHEYDLETACRVLRVLLYLGDRDEKALLAMGSRFLLAQQTEEGSFGFLGRECASLRRRFPGTRADLKLRLRITTSVLWTLAELHGRGYRLLRDLGRGFAAAQRERCARATA